MPSRAITLTLPEETLNDLLKIDRDRSQAIVKLTKSALGKDESPRSMVEVVEMVADIGLLVVGPSALLRRIPFLHLVEVSAGRYLMALAPGNDVKSLEIAITDIVDDLPEREERERALLLELLGHLRKLRKKDRVSMAELLFVSLKQVGVIASTGILQIASF
ncbi:hypothetical protein [Roseimicrobium gellanilyticum]|uniref:hypothetical protein n=1 Tax=Roseimicrobium gellanilyticum TaxID=748857 RepID=UPI0014746897|nr:hypothetical protein [Roseimicrobium gellanilyticum]